MFLRLVKKDLLLEFRSKSNFLLYVLLSLLLALVSAFGLRSAQFSNAEILKAFPGLYWLGFLFVATLVVEKSYDQELEAGALDAVILSGISDLQIYFSKLFSNFVLVIFSQSLALIFYLLFLNLNIADNILALSFVNSLVVLAYLSISQLFTLIARRGELINLILPLILLPLLFPLFFSAVELSLEVVMQGALPYDSVWFSVLCATVVIYIALGVNLFKFVLI